MTDDQHESATESDASVAQALADMIKDAPPEVQQRALELANVNKSGPSAEGWTTELFQTFAKIAGQATEAGAKAGIRSTMRENPNYVKSNVYHPTEIRDGVRVKVDKPPFLGTNGRPREVFLVGVREDWNRCTVEEVALYNRFTKSVTVREGQWRANVIHSTSGGNERLEIFFPNKDVDDRMVLPSLIVILTELLDGKEAVDPVSLASSVASLKEEVASLLRQAAEHAA